MTSTQQAEPRPPSTALRLARDPKVVVAGGFILLLIILAVFAPLIAPQDPLAQNLLAATLPPLGFPDAEPGFLLGTDGLAISRWPEPAVNSLVKSTIGYRIRPGKHDVTTDDWDAFMDFADFHWKSPENRGNP